MTISNAQKQARFRRKEELQKLADPSAQKRPVKAKTAGAAQRNWKTPTEFPCCPDTVGFAGVAEYAASASAGELFSRNHFSQAKVAQSVLSADQKRFWVLGDHGAGAIKQWSLTQVTMEDGLFVHESIGTFFSLEGAQKQFCLAQGLPWEGGDSIDDYC